MPLKPTVKIDPDDIVRYLLYQQFYYGEDRIYGRTKDRSEYIENAEKAIEDFYSLITEPINLIDEGHIEQYLEFFNENIIHIPIEAILEKYQETIDILGPDINHKMILTVVIGEALIEIYKRCFEDSINELIEFIIERRSLNSEKKKEIKRKIKSLYGKSNPDIGMIYSLGFMEFMAKKVGYQEIVTKCEQLLKKYFKLILEVLK